MANKKDYYEILGIPKSSGEAEIKSAYKKLAKEHHPDMVKDTDKAAAEKRFKEINEAYQVLSDPQQRKMYDQFGHTGPGFGGGQGAGYEGFGGGQSQWGPFTYTYTQGGTNVEFDPFDIFEEFFGFRGFGGRRKPKKGKNLYYEMHVDFIEAVQGLEKEIKVESGKVKIKIPAGVRHGTEIKFPGKGMPGQEKTPNGDLYITFKVPTPKEFTQRVGDNLGTIVELDFVQAALGDTIEVPIVDASKRDGVGKAKLKIPQGTQPNTQFRVRDKGMPKLRGNGSGDVIVQAQIKIPQKLSRRQRKILEDYQNS
jgi:molecular chaperone DnaJ